MIVITARDVCSCQCHGPPDTFSIWLSCCSHLDPDELPYFERPIVLDTTPWNFVETSSDAKSACGVLVECDGRAFHLTARFSHVGGRMEPTSITITATDGGPVTGTAIRRLPIGTAIQQMRGPAARKAGIV